MKGTSLQIILSKFLGKPWNEQQIELFAPYKKRIKMIILKDFTDKPEAAHRRIASQLRMFMDDISNTMIFGGNVSKRLLEVQLGSWGSLEDYVNCKFYSVDQKFG
jgi:hypothetical protein